MDTKIEPFESGNEPPNNCIGNLEHHVHKVFALVRVPGEDFVYSPSMDLFNKLDAYCDEQTMAESKPPLVIKGESGTGKSALLSNWLQRRERITMRSRSMVDEFVFWHAVGCSRQSMNVNFLIRRLIVELKDRFELGRNLPKTQERYSWELPRFLDLASKRGKVIIVIDGLNRLVNNENVEDSLAWLPLEFPPNVRVILSVTTQPESAPQQQHQHQQQQGSRHHPIGAKVAGHKGESGLSPTYSGSAAASPTYTLTQSKRPFSAGSARAEHNEQLLTSAPSASTTTSPSGGKRKAPLNSTTASASNIVINWDSIGERDSDGGDGNGYYGADDDDDGSNGGDATAQRKSKRSRILQELARREIPCIVMKPLDKQLCRSLVEAFIHKSVNSETAALATGPYIHSYLKTRPERKKPPAMLSHLGINIPTKGDSGVSGHDGVNGSFGPSSGAAAITTSGQGPGGARSSTVLLGISDPANTRGGRVHDAAETVPGFLLFENQITTLLNHSQGGTPLFLRMFLRCLQYAVSRGYSLWRVYEDWMQAHSVPELLMRILATLEGNFTRTRETSQADTDKTIAAGGLPALKTLYSWHPSFQHQQQQQQQQTSSPTWKWSCSFRWRCQRVPT